MREMVGTLKKITVAATKNFFNSPLFFSKGCQIIYAILPKSI